MRFFLVTAILTFLATCVSAVVQQQSVLVTYPQDTPQSVIDKAMEAITNNGGIVTHEFRLIKGFSAQAPASALDAVKAVGDQYVPLIEGDSVVSIQGTAAEPTRL